jgi:hypothetical protein
MMAMQSETLFSYRHDQYYGPFTCALRLWVNGRWLELDRTNGLAAYRHNHVERSSEWSLF